MSNDPLDFTRKVYRCGSLDAYENLVHKLESQLKEAHEVIGLASAKDFHETDINTLAVLVTRESLEEYFRMVGKRAREYQEKYGVKNEN